MRTSSHLRSAFLVTTVSLIVASAAVAQDGNRRSRGAPRPVTVPVTIKVKKPEVEIRVVDLMIREDGDVQSMLSMRKPADNPITLAVLLQDDLVPSIANEAKPVATFVRQLPAGSRVMVAYIRSGSLSIPRKFTNDLSRAAAAIRPPLGVASAGPYNPYVEIILSSTVGSEAWNSRDLKSRPH